MTDATALLAAIRAAPDDDAPRLVYADWLDEHGQPERAEFIRVQCALARADSPALRRREAELLAAHHDEFAGLLLAPGFRFRFERGFPVAFGHTGLFGATEPRAGLEPLNYYLRFFPNGILQVTSTTATPKQVKRWHREAYQLALRAAYVLEPFGTPAVLTAKELPRRGVSPDLRAEFSGTLDFDSITLTELDPERGHQVQRRYSHQPVRGFDSFSFPET
jgi:uncharacterized protein (TIGR02996 family)